MFIKDIIRSVLLGKFLLNYSTFQYDNIVFMIFKKLKFKPSINKIRDELETIKRSLVTSNNNKFKFETTTIKIHLYSAVFIHKHNN